MLYLSVCVDLIRYVLTNYTHKIYGQSHKCLNIIWIVNVLSSRKGLYSSNNGYERRLRPVSGKSCERPSANDRPPYKNTCSQKIVVFECCLIGLAQKQFQRPRCVCECGTLLTKPKSKRTIYICVPLMEGEEERQRKEDLQTCLMKKPMPIMKCES